MFAHSKTTIATITLLLSMWALIISTVWAIWSFDITALKVAATSVVLIVLSATYMATTEDDMT